MALIKDFDVKGPRILHRTLRFDCYYINELGNRDRVKIEFYLSQPPFVEANIALVKSPFVESYPTMFRVYSFEDLLAKKLIALYNRTEGKDIYDVFYALRLYVDKRKFREALKENIRFYRVKEENFLNKLIIKLDNAKKNAKYIGNSTNHFIPKALRPNWEEMIDSLKSALNKINL